MRSSTAAEGQKLSCSHNRVVVAMEGIGKPPPRPCGDTCTTVECVVPLMALSPQAEQMEPIKGKCRTPGAYEACRRQAKECLTYENMSCGVGT